MVSFWSSFFMCLPIYNTCRTCKYIHFVSPTQAKCKHFIYLNAPFILEDPNDFYIENELYLDVEAARIDPALCGRNATMYERRLK